VAEWQSADDPNNREKISRARRAAEQLFKPMPANGEQELPPQPGSGDGAAVPERRRSPRIFTMPPRVPASAQSEPAAEPKPPPRLPAARRRSAGVPPSQFGRIRALATYGMTRQQVADLYGVTVEEIGRILDYPAGSGNRQ
jgi:hypothetical protein